MAPKMTEVYAVADGVIEAVGTSSRSGRYVTIKHFDGWTSTYIHLNNDDPGTDDGRATWNLTIASGIFEGAVVRAGQMIGYVGDSGNAEGSQPHTHFELALNGHPVNPYSLLEEAWLRDNDLYVEGLAMRRYASKLDVII
jgi:murein DD-endopeptidase MepM/ murein hydrolase activator NlpD